MRSSGHSFGDMEEFPSITFIIPTYDAARHLGRCLASLRNQDYPQEKVKILILDGGSTDDTRDIAVRFNCAILENKKRLAEYGVQLGMHNCHTDLVVVFAADNELCGRDWINRIKLPFLQEPSLAAAWCRLAASSDDRALNKYFSLIQSDPFSFFLNKNLNYYLRSKTLKKVGSFSIFNVEKLRPLVWGANGLTYRRQFIQDIWKQEGYLGDNDAFQTMVSGGKNKVAYCAGLFVYHHHVATLREWMGKWRRNYRLHFLDKLNTRNLEWVFIPHFNIRLSLWLTYSLVPVFSGLHCIYLIFREKNIYWLYHPLVSFLQTLVYIRITLFTQEGRSLLRNLFMHRVCLKKKENVCTS